MSACKVKICGITSHEVALQSVNAGADALGFVFYDKSPRAVSVERAKRIIQALPPFVTSVGLFVNASEQTVRTVCDHTQLDLIQFHGDETNEFCVRLNKPFIKAVRVKSAACVITALQQFPDAKALLLDAYVEGQPGGTGRQFDWSFIPLECDKPLIVAGGLKPDNVSAAIKASRPYAVDVSGGVEKAKGVKDIAKIKQFIQAVQTAAQE